MPDGPSKPLRIVFASSEVAGFAKTGGLADVCAALPRALARHGHECAVFLPLYQSVRRGRNPPVPLPHTLVIPMRTRTIVGKLWQGTLPDSRVPVYFIDQKEFFDRDDPVQGHGLYQYALPGGHRRDYADNAERFVFFARAVLEALPLIGKPTDILHLNDWQTGLIPVLLKETYARRSSYPYSAIRSLFTIHNIAYQGTFPPHEVMQASGLDPRLYNHRQLEFYGAVSFLKAGLVFADKLSTVSPLYAQEIQTQYYGCGLQGLLSERRHDLVGIVNGVDYREWDPSADPHLAVNYTPETVTEGKAKCKRALQDSLGLDPDPAAPVAGMVARLVEQKGVDLVIRAADALIREDGVQLAILGEGDPEYHRQLEALRDRHPGRVGLKIGFSELLAHRIEAGSDLFFMPSLFEPSGLNQLYSLRYGTVPVVKATGGLADTIADATPEALAAGTATGFRFQSHTPAAFLDCVRRALALFKGDPAAWKRLQQTGMRQDWSWDRIAGLYEALYRSMLV